MKNPKMCYNHYTARWLHLFNMLFLTFFCLLFLSHESCACGVSKRKAEQRFSNSPFSFPRMPSTSVHTLTCQYSTSSLLKTDV